MKGKYPGLRIESRPSKGGKEVSRIVAAVDIPPPPASGIDVVAMRDQLENSARQAAKHEQDILRDQVFNNQNRTSLILLCI